MKGYPPMEIMREETSRAVMNGLLIHDISSTADRNTAAPSNPLPGDNCEDRGGRYMLRCSTPPVLAILTGASERCY